MCVQFSDRYLPEVQALEGEKPRVFFDVPHIEAWDGPERMQFEGEMILRVRTYLDRNEKNLRVVLDLEPSKDYVVNQTYDEYGNIFCLDTTPENLQ